MGKYTLRFQPNTVYMPKRPVTPEEIKVTLAQHLVENRRRRCPRSGVSKPYRCTWRRDRRRRQAEGYPAKWNGTAINAMLLRDLKTGKPPRIRWSSFWAFEGVNGKTVDVGYDARDGGRGLGHYGVHLE